MSDNPTIEQAFAPRWNGGQWLLAEQMLTDLDQLFSAHQLAYFLTYGSLLGAVRHQGVIPWDDDIDIAIFQQDEQRMRTLANELRKAGYGLIELTKENPDGSLGRFYKIWISSIPSTFDRDYSWPYIDVFLVRGAPDEEVWMLDDDRFPSSYFLPLQRAKFGAHRLPLPADTGILSLMYGADHMDICVSTNFDHRHAKPCPSIRAAAVDIKEAGCFTDLATAAQHLLASCATQVSGWVLTQDSGTYQLKNEHTALTLGKGAAALWNMLDGNISLGDMIDSLPAPRIAAIHAVLETLGNFAKLGAIHMPAGTKATG